MEHATEPANAPIWPKPPVVALLFLLAGIALDYAIPLRTPGLPIPFENALVGCLILLCAAGIIFASWREMERARTTIMPGQPATALVTSGVFRRSRNPIYLSFALMLFGSGIALTNPWMIVLTPLLVVYFQRRVIQREEEYLTRRFGEAYLAYKKQTRRWF